MTLTITLQQAAKHSGYKKNTIRNAIRRGDIMATKDRGGNYRICTRSLENFITARLPMPKPRTKPRKRSQISIRLASAAEYKQNTERLNQIARNATTYIYNGEVRRRWSQEVVG